MLVFVCARAQGQPLSENMTWDQIGRALEAYPPSPKYCDQRLKIMESMDRLITVRVKDPIQEEDKTRLKETVEFYRRRVDRGLNAIEKSRVKEGVRVFKFYSSSLILKGANGVVAVDFCQGPIDNGGEPEKADRCDTGFYLTPEQRDRLARLVDVALITHRHHDHADYSLSKRLIDKGRPVIGPAQLQTHWPDIGPRVIVPKYETAQRFGPCEIFTQFGYQYGKSEILEDGERHGVPHPDGPERDSESVRYLIRMEGITFLQSAENHVEADKWLEKAAGLGWKVNVLLSPGQCQGGRSVMKVLQRYVSIPLHEYEMTHEGGGNRTAQHLKGSSRKAVEEERLIPLLWGEDALITKKLVKFTY